MSEPSDYSNTLKKLIEVARKEFKKRVEEGVSKDMHTSQPGYTRYEEYANDFLDRLWEAKAIDYGFWIREEDVPTLDDYLYNPDPSLFEGEVSAARLEALESGAKPTKREFDAYRENWLFRATFEPDADKIPGFALCPWTDARGYTWTVLVLRLGYSFSGLSTWFEDLFESAAAAREYMKKQGEIG